MDLSRGPVGGDQLLLVPTDKKALRRQKISP